MNEFEHLLSKHGLLVNFNISKKIKTSTIIALRKKLSKIYTVKSELNRALDKKLISSEKKTFDINNIPGIIFHTSSFTEPEYPDVSPKLKQKIIFAATKTSELLVKYKFNKVSIILFIQLLIRLCNITPLDMENFKQKYYNNNNQPEDDYLNDEDDDDLDDEDDDKFND